MAQRRVQVLLTAALMAVSVGCAGTRAVDAASTPAVTATPASESDTTVGVTATSTDPAMDTPAASPTGFRPVTFHGLTVDVPADWTTDGTQCGYPVEPTVVLVHTAVAACGLGTIPAVPSLQLGVDPHGTAGHPELDSGTWTETTLAGLAARRQDSPPTPEWPVFRTDLAVPDRDALLTVRAPTQPAVDALLATVRIDTADVNGCPASIDVTDPLAVGDPPARPGADATVVPDGATSLVTCTYGDGLVESSGTLDDADRARLTAAVNATPAGLSVVDPRTYARQGCTDGIFGSNDRVLHRLTFRYPDGPDVAVTVRLVTCGTSGISNGTVTHQATEDLTVTMMELSHQGSGPGAFIPAG